MNLLYVLSNVNIQESHGADIGVPIMYETLYLLVFILPGFEAWHSGPGTWQLGYFWEVCDRSFGSSYSSGLSKGARGVSGAIIAITHNRFLQVFHYCLKNRKVFEKDIDFVL